MRILFVSHYALPHLGGIEVIVHELASEMGERGHEVVHVASAAGPTADPSPSYRLVRVPALNPLEDRWDVPYPLFGPALRGVLRRELACTDVVHAHGFLYQGTLTAFALARRREARPALVLSEHVGHVPYASRVLDAAEAAAIATLGRWSARRADAVVVYNETVRERIARLAPRARLEWIDNPIDTDLFRPPSPDERARLRAGLGWDERPRVLFVGRAVEKKGLEVALEAAREANGSFVLAVAGGEVPAVAGTHVERLGVLPRERIALVYRAADALLAPSRGEGLPLAVLEALASGLPVVASDDPGYRESLRDAGSALKLLAPDGRAMGRALRELLSEPAPGDAGVQLVGSRFSKAASASAHELLYAELWGGGGQRAPTASSAEAGDSRTSTNLPHPSPPPEGVRGLATRAAMRNLVRRPGWFARNLLQGPEYLLDKRRRTGVGPFRHLVEPEADAVCAVVGADREEYARALEGLWIPQADPEEPLTAWNARVELLRVLGAVVRLLRPRVMIETGVALGFTTAVALRAMADNGEGHLYSIDLPHPQYEHDRPVGDAVPPELRDRWTLELGDSRRLLEPLARRVAPVDVFLHDALHTYSSQMREYTTIWPHLRPGGVIASDDVDNPAFVEFAEQVGCEPHLVLGPSRPSAIGLLRKPGATAGPAASGR
jgi:D-inositol-3-phosphate glycosyltransferase